VTGGSAGLGLAMAVLLTQRGADVSIVARNKERLQKALAEMEVRVYNLLRDYLRPT
jgi:3-dehydrosphinganine reductase